MARMKRPSHIERGRIAAYNRDRQRDEWAERRGVCVVCGKNPPHIFADGVPSVTCDSEVCFLTYLPGGEKRLQELKLVVLADFE